MAERDEMADGVGHAAAMVCRDRVDRQLGLQLAFHRDDRAVELGQSGKQPVVVLARRRNQDAVDAAAVERADIGGIGRRVVAGAHHQKRVAGRSSTSSAPATISAENGLDSSEVTKPISLVAPRRKLWAT